MPARIVVFCTPKGGAGKTTLAVNVAATLSGPSAGKPAKVLLLDADPQQSALKWAKAVPDHTSLPMVVTGYTGRKIPQEIRKVVDAYDFILVDTPPSSLALSTVAKSALLAADLAVVPVVPSPLDIWEAARIAEFFGKINEVRAAGGVAALLTRLVVNRLKPRTAFAQQVQEALESFPLPLCQTAIHEREAYKHAALDGTSVHQVKGAGGRAAAEEIAALTRELASVLSPPAPRGK